MNDRTLPTTDTKTAIDVDERGSWAYPSLAESGLVEIELPTLPGSLNSVERLHACDFGRHVAGAVERSMRGNPYKSGPQQGPAQVLKHYGAVAKGAGLLDESTLEYIDRLSKEFAATKGEDRAKYHATMVRPFLNSLTPKRRQK